MSKAKAIKEALAEIGDADAVQKFLRALKGESDDAVSKMGSGKNLDALQQAKMNAPSIEPKAYPKNITQDSLADAPASRSTDFVMTDESLLPTVRGNTMPTVGPGANPEILGKAAPLPDMGMNKAPQFDINASTLKNTPDPMNPYTVGQAAPKSMDDLAGAMDGQLDDMLQPKSNKLRNTGLAATGLAAGGAGVMMLNDDQQASSMGAAPPILAAATTALMNKAMEPKPVAPQAPALPRSPAVEAPIEDIPAPEQDAQLEEAQYLQELKAAQGKQDQDNFVDNMLRAGITTGAGIAGTKADYAGVDALQKQNGIGVQNVKDKMTADMDNKKLKQAQTELNDEKKLRDPKSDVSGAFRQALAKLGIKHSDKTTAADAKAMGINIQNLLMQEKQIAASLAKDSGKSGAKDDKMVQSLRKELTSGEIGKLYNSYSTARRTKQMVEAFAKNPTGYSDYGTLMNSLKTLQGDASTVREAEMKLGMEAGSLSDKYKNIWSKAKNGQSLQPQQRQDIINAVQTLAEISSANYLNAAAPILKQSERLGFSSDELLNDGLSPSNTEEKKEQPMVKVTRISDGASKMMTAEAAAKADKKKYTVGN